uniref:Uncharacterized protein n=1 Tax=Daphnia galeata TaxID=27404 RepID=A0A8J2R9D3_9CRUS|nr:unnamed protein product [Daphnia galeata]
MILHEALMMMMFDDKVSEKFWTRRDAPGSPSPDIVSYVVNKWIIFQIQFYSSEKIIIDRPVFCSILGTPLLSSFHQYGRANRLEFSI